METRCVLCDLCTRIISYYLGSLHISKDYHVLTVDGIPDRALQVLTSHPVNGCSKFFESVPTQCIYNRKKSTICTLHQLSHPRITKIELKIGILTLYMLQLMQAQTSQ